LALIAQHTTDNRYFAEQVDSVVISKTPTYYIENVINYLTKIGYRNGEKVFYQEFYDCNTLKQLTLKEDSFSIELRFDDLGIEIREFCYKSPKQSHGYCYEIDSNNNIIAYFPDFERMNGTYIEYFDNGRVAAETPYVFGKRQGFYKGYFQNGNLLTVQEFQNDTLNGLWQEFFPSGRLLVQAKTLHNNFDGKHITYNEDGTILSIKAWKEGVLISNEE
jgi:antitoxin component YwqK of YwqJK toxin-antitoxin module